MQTPQQPTLTIPRRTLLTAAACLPALALAEAPLKVVAVYSLPFEHLWVSCIHRPLSEAHRRGEITYQAFENTSPTAYTDLLRQLVHGGFDLIVGESNRNNDAIHAVAKAFPEQHFLWWSLEGAKAPNLSVYQNYVYEPAYLAGMLAASLSPAQHLGLIGGFAQSHTLTILNAFVQGAKEINPKIRVSSAVIKSWYNPTRASKMTQAMLKQGADTFFAITHAGVVETAAANKALAFNCMANQQDQYPKTVVSAVLWHTEPMFKAVWAQLRNKTFHADNYVAYSSMKVGGSSLAPLTHFAPQVSSDLKALLQKRTDDIKSGQFIVPRSDQLQLTM